MLWELAEALELLAAHQPLVLVLEALPRGYSWSRTVCVLAAAVKALHNSVPDSLVK